MRGDSLAVGHQSVGHLGHLPPQFGNGYWRDQPVVQVDELVHTPYVWDTEPLGGQRPDWDHRGPRHDYLGIQHDEFRLDLVEPTP